jgi:mannosyltransferase
MLPTSARPRYFYGTAALILLVGFGLRVWELGSASLWIDEIWTEYRMRAKLVLESGNQTPLYFTVLHFFPNNTEFLLRLPSAIMGMAGIGLLIFVVVQLYQRFDLALVAGALLAVNPYHVWLSRMARPYPLVFILSLLASFYFLVLLSGRRTRAVWAGFVLCSMAAYLTHYYTIGLPLAQYALFAFILKGNRGFFRQWLKAQLVASLPTLIWVYLLSRQEAVAFGIGWIPRPGLKDVPLTFWNMTIGYDGSLPWWLVPGLAAAAVGLLLGVVYAVRERKTNRVNFYWFWLIAAPLALGFAVSLFRPVYVDRYFMVFLPAVLLLMAQGWERIPRQTWRIGLSGVVLLVCLSSIVIALQNGTDQKEDWRATATYVQQQRQPGDAVLTETPIELLALRRYLGGDMERAWLLDAPPLAEQFKAPVTRVWAIYRNPDEDGHIQGALPGFDPFKPSNSPMPGWLIAHRSVVISQKEFNGVAVVLVDVGDESAKVAD